MSNKPCAFPTETSGVKYFIPIFFLCFFSLLLLVFDPFFPCCIYGPFQQETAAIHINCQGGQLYFK